MNLFSNRERTSLEGADYRESAFAYLNRSARPMAGRIRDFFEGAYAAYPEHGQSDLRGRFLSRRPEVHLAALVELLTFAILRASGYDVEIHPQIPDTTRRPDFRATTAGLSFLVECTTANASEDDAKAADRRFEAVDLLDEVVSDRWTIVYHSGRTGEKPIPRARFLDAIRAWIASLDAATGSENEDSQPELLWEEDGWEIRLLAYRLKPGTAADGSRGGYMSEVTTVDATRRVRRAIEGKSSAYGPDPKEPLIVVVVPGVEFARDEHLFEALFGDKEWIVDHRAGTVVNSYKRNGAWRGADGFRGGLVSAVLYTPRLHAWGFVDRAWRLVHHPEPTHPVPIGVLPFAEEVAWTAEGESDVRDPSQSLRGLFSLNDEWPGPDD